MQWDLFCRVIDNFGDIGVSWRLAADLASRGESVRLWVDDASALRWMAPGSRPGVEVIEGFAAPTPSGACDVVVETFGCALPAWFQSRMAAQVPAPVWINLEYLSAEPYVARSHGLRSPQSDGPAAGLNKWFFYPGFTPDTGGLLREPDLIEQLDQLNRDTWLRQHGWAPQVGERVVVLFSYELADWPRWLRWLAAQPTLLLVCPGALQADIVTRQLPATVRLVTLPWMNQSDFDALLRCSDLNFVRGEDSLARAIWAARPLVWQIYPQSDGAHKIKLTALLDQLKRHAPGSVATQIESVWRAWNHLQAWPDHPPEPTAWAEACAAWRAHLLSQGDLCSQLIRFATDRR